MSIINFTERLMRNRHNRAACSYLSNVNEYADRYRREVNHVLDQLNKYPGRKIILGKTEWSKNISIPEEELLKTHGLITGATGANHTKRSKS